MSVNGTKLSGMRLIYSSIVFAIFITKCYSQSCDDFITESSCNQSSSTPCQWIDGLCGCSSDVKLDILFGRCIEEFDTTCKANRQQVFIMITDGTPFDATVGYINLCGSDYDYDSQLQSAGIYRIICDFHF